MDNSGNTTVLGKLRINHCFREITDKPLFYGIFRKYHCFMGYSGNTTVLVFFRKYHCFGVFQEIPLSWCHCTCPGATVPVLVPLYPSWCTVPVPVPVLVHCTRPRTRPGVTVEYSRCHSGVFPVSQWRFPR